MEGFPVCVHRLRGQSFMFWQTGHPSTRCVVLVRDANYVFSSCNCRRSSRRRKRACTLSVRFASVSHLSLPGWRQLAKHKNVDLVVGTSSEHFRLYANATVLRGYSFLSFPPLCLYLDSSQFSDLGFDLIAWQRNQKTLPISIVPMSLIHTSTIPD